MSTRPNERIPGLPTPSPAQPPETDESPATASSSEETVDTEDFSFAEAMEDYEHHRDDFGHLEPVAEGEVLHGTVLSVTPTELIVDVGLKSEGAVPIAEVTSPDGVVTFQAGDSIDVMVDRSASGTPLGFIGLSHTRAMRVKVWDTLEQAHRENLSVYGRILSRTRGGLLVDVGAEAFMPLSHVDLRPVHNLDNWVGQDVPVRVLKLNRRRGNLVVSRKAAVQEEEEARQAAILDTIHEGAEVTGVVKNLTDYGAFVDLGGIDGLLHVSDMSHGRINHPSELLQPGDSITVKVLKFDRERQRISLGLKQMAPDPWETVAERYVIGSRVIGRVVSITDYGAFVELEAGVEGLIHISEMTWSRRMKHPSKIVKVGDPVEAVVLDVKSGDRRVSLGIKQLEADPWTTVADRYSVGSVVEGRVRKLTDFGAFLEIEEGVDGLVHISDFSWSKRIKHPSELVRKGQVMQAVILAIDTEARRLSLGIKQLQPDAWESFFNAHMVNDIVRGKVKRAAQFGVFVELAPGVEGLCHNSEIPGTQRGGGPEPPLPIGEEMDFKIIRMSEAEKRIGLSLNAIADDEERTRLQRYRKQAEAATSGLDDVAGFGSDS
jgi:small subunit ribosomal protein S1